MGLPADGIHLPALRHGRSALLFLALPLILSGCGDRAPEFSEPAEPPFPLYEPAVRPGDGLLDSAALQEVVEAGLRRDAEALIAYFGDDDDAVRARAAFAAASMQDSTLIGPLFTLLNDPAPTVRRDAAFALGHFSLPDGGDALISILPLERNREVRHHLIEALGKQGDEAALARLLDLGVGSHEEVVRTLALARFFVRGVDHPYLTEALVQRLMLTEWTGREAAAWAFARAGTPDRWRGYVDGLRDALDLGFPDDASVPHLLTALGQAEDRDDLERLRSHLQEGANARIRANAARALGTTFWLETSGVREALMEAVESDPSEHVAVAAAGALTGGFRVPPPVREFAREWVAGPPNRWRSQLPLLATLVQEGEVDVLVPWIRRVAPLSPHAAARGVTLLAGIPGEAARDALLEWAGDPSPRIRGAALAALEDRIFSGDLDEEGVRGLMERFAREAGEGEELPTFVAIRALSNPVFLEFGSRGVLEEVFEVRRGAGDPSVLQAVLQAFARTGDAGVRPLLESLRDDPRPEIRRAGAEALFALTRREVDGEAWGLDGLEFPVEWALLRRVGPDPEILIETERGGIRVRLAPEVAPQTVSALLTQILAGAHDEGSFHRVIPNFVIQGGDIGVGDGTGGPPYRLRTELTGIPFQRGGFGMASAGRDTEGSQWFLTHSYQPHLDSGYTAAGWAMEGAEVLDRILEGESILHVQIVSSVTM